MRLELPSSRVLGLSFLCIAISSPAYGYIDPGTGSLIIQGVIGAIAAIGVTLKLYWHKLKLFFSRRDEKAENEEANDSSS
jgi:hypothetical protein